MSYKYKWFYRCYINTFQGMQKAIISVFTDVLQGALRDKWQPVGETKFVAA